MNENMMEARMELGRGKIVDLTAACQKAYENRTNEFVVEYKMQGQEWQTRKCTSLENMQGFMKRVRELGGIC